jgi:D-alanyl-D-alanine carboxypeptidase/D-alanyl-D-alanine-endopeptidase (penicillin-binding protein 4)
MIEGRVKKDRVQKLKRLFLFLVLIFFFFIPRPLFLAPAEPARPSLVKATFFPFSLPSFSPDRQSPEVLTNLSKRKLIIISEFPAENFEHPDIPLKKDFSSPLLSSNSSPLRLTACIEPASSLQAQRQFNLKVQSLLNNQRFRRTTFSISIRWAGTGETIYEHRAHERMIPASNMKLITSAAAIQLLGLDFEFKTRVALASQSLIIIGSGDPLLGDQETDKRYGRRPDWLLEDIASRLLIKGIKSVKDIIIDTSIFDDQRVHPSWPQNVLLQKYACEVSGLNYRGNCLELTVVNRQGKTFVLSEPKTSYVKFINETLATSAAENWFSVSRTSSPLVLRVTGKIRSQAGPYAVSVANPALFFGTLLKEHLMRKGIEVEGQVREEKAPAESELEVIAEYRTPLLDVLRRVNKDSLGLAAEALFKTLGTLDHPEGRGGSWATGRRVITRFLLDLGIPENEFFLDDGSGLSRENRLTSYALTSLLLWLYRQPCWPAFESTLAVGGVDGTLENVFRERNLQGRVVAKTGYINGVRALSGITHTRSGDIIFSFLANNASNVARSIINSIVKELTSWADSLLGSGSSASSPGSDSKRVNFSSSNSIN